MTASPPAFAVRGKNNSILLEMPGLGNSPASGRLLRGLTPFLDEQGADHVFLLTERKWREPWAESPEKVISYQELVHWEREPDGGKCRGVCSKDGRLAREDILQAFEYEPLSLIDFAARRLGVAVISNREPLSLGICYIEKPWGREGWYTGIEKRGVSTIRTTTGSTELPYALGMFPVPLIGEREVPPILLKTLEPLAEPVYGDLYLEVHREKWETYVVLSVDPEAWPDGKGGLRSGLDGNLVASYKKKSPKDWEKAIAGDLTDAIRAYEKVRREIDALLDQALRERGADPDLPVAPGLHKELLAQVPEDLRALEQERRSAVEAFLGEIRLRPGDIVNLPPGVLHSLRHGVRVIEFQTPTYERLIAMFAQKVLTQPHWDVEEAIALMDKEPFRPAPLEVLEEEEGVLVERVVDFPQFHVERTRLQLNRHRAERTAGGNQYQLLIATEGKGELVLPGGQSYTMEPEAAYFLPATLGPYDVHAISAQGVSYLQASPEPEAEAEPDREELSLEEVLERTW